MKESDIIREEAKGDDDEVEPLEAIKAAKDEARGKHKKLDLAD